MHVNLGWISPIFVWFVNMIWERRWIRGEKKIDVNKRRVVRDIPGGADNFKPEANL